jgi:DNA-binding response OmpR family regulator
MLSALICTQQDLESDLADTPLWRSDVERHIATKPDEARMLAVAARPRIVVVDSALPWAGRFVASLREDPDTRAISIVALARGDFDPSEVELLEAGANGILRLPLGADGSERLERLMNVPVRRQARFIVHFNVDAPIPPPSGAEPALAVNLSESGMLLETRLDLGVRQEVTLEFKLPDGDHHVHGRARVVRVAGTRQFGLEFTDLEPEDAPRIRAFLETLGTTN